MRRLKAALALAGALAGCVASAPAMAWGSNGHRAVGAIADQLIQGSSAQRHVAALLQPGESLETISLWADCAKVNPPAGCGTPTLEMVAYVAANPGHAGYHYADVPFELAHYHDHDIGTRADDVVQVLKQAIAVLQGRADDASNPHHFTPRQALLLVAHLVGDIHQPLHMGGAYVAKAGGFAVPESREQIKDGLVFDTRGAQDLLVSDAVLGESTSANHGLHSFWDFVLVEDVLRRSGAASPQQFAQMAIAMAPVVDANTGDAASWPYQWADEALMAAKPAFDGVVPGAMAQQADDKGKMRNVWPLTLPDNYRAASADVAQEQMIRAGYHLAALLKAIWP